MQDSVQSGKLKTPFFIPTMNFELQPQDGEHSDQEKSDILCSFWFCHGAGRGAGNSGELLKSARRASFQHHGLDRGCALCR